MKILKSANIALLGAFLLAACSVSTWAQAAQQTSGQNQSDTNTAKKDKKSEKSDAGASTTQSAPDSGTASSKKKSTSKADDTQDKGTTAPNATPPSSKTSNTPQQPPAKSARMVWANTDSGIYHKPGSTGMERQKEAST